MLTQGRAKSMASSLSGYPKSTRSTRTGTFFFDVNKQAGSATLVADTRALSNEENVELRKVFKSLTGSEVIDVTSGEVLAFSSPYSHQRPRTGSRPSFQTREKSIHIYHLHSMWDWTVPAVLFDIRPKVFTREFALQIYCEHVAKSQHERLRAHNIVHQAST